MPVTLTQATKDELKRKKPRLRNQAEIIKNYYASQTVIDITDKVISWGRYQNDSTFVKKKWEMPNLTMIVSNEDDYFHDTYSGSLWQASPAKEVFECVLRVRLWVHSDTGNEVVLTYIGRILDCSLQASAKFATAEIITVFEPADKLDDDCTVKSGSWTSWANSVETNHNKGGICFPAPDIRTWVGWMAGPPFPWERATCWYVCTLMVIESENIVSGETYQPTNRKSSSAILIGASNVNVDYSATAGVGANYDVKYYNPPAYYDYNPSEIIEDFLMTVAGVDSGFVDSTSFGTVDTYFAGQTPAYDLRAVLFGKTFIEHVLEIASYAPETFLFYSYDSKIHYIKIPAYSGTPSPYILSTKGSINNIISIDGIGKDYDRLITDVEAVYHANTQGNNWAPVHETIIGGRKMGQDAQDVNLFTISDSVSPTPSKTHKRRLEKPWFNAGLASHYMLVGNYAANLLDIRGAGIDTYSLKATPAALETEQGDVVAIDEYHLNLDEKKVLLVGKGYDFDRHEVILTLMDKEFT